jgi:hypothetical protein
MIRTATFLVAWVVLGASAALAQSDQTYMSDQGLTARIERLEAQNREMMAELQAERARTADAYSAPAGPAAPPPATTVQYAVPGPDVGVPGPDAAVPQATILDLDTEIKKFAWKKGDVTVVPYGILWGNAVYASERTYPGSYTLWVDSASKAGEAESIVDARNTRLGVDVLGPQVAWFGGAQLGGKVEVDFQGADDVTENKGGLLLRHAYVELKNDEFRLLAGQTWDIISPLCPSTLMYSVNWEAGNIGYRRAQVRGERYYALSDSFLVTVQSSIDQNVFSDEITNVDGAPSAWPIVEGRVAVTLGERTGPNALPMTFGVSSHVGQQEFDLMNGSAVVERGQLRNTWSLNGDIRIPITYRFGFQGEFFTGQDLSAFLGGIGQGLDPTTLQAVHSTGGWAEFWYDWTPCLHSHVGYSLDNPDINDLPTVGDRTYNQVIYGNLSYDLTKECLVGVELGSWKTLYVGEAPGDALRCEFVVKYSF